MNTAQANPASPRVQLWLSARTPWQRRGLALLAGGLATLGHAPFQAAPAYILAIVALVWLLDLAVAQPKRAATAFAVGWWFGLGHLASGLYWVSSAFNVDSAAWGPIWGVPATLALVGGLALFWGAGCAVAILLFDLFHWSAPDAVLCGALLMAVAGLCYAATEGGRGAPIPAAAAVLIDATVVTVGAGFCVR